MVTFGAEKKELGKVEVKRKEKEGQIKNECRFIDER